MTIENLEMELKEKKLKSLYLLYGEELFLLETTLKKIKDIFGDTIKGINYIYIDETNVSNIISDIETPAFCYEKKLIIARNTGLFKKGTQRKNTELLKVQEKLDNYIKENINIINSSVVLVFVEETIEKQSLLNTIEKYGIVCKFEYQKIPQIEKRIKNICNAYKVNINNNDLRYFIECCGTNMQDLINEIRKLIEYTGEKGKIEKKDIDMLSTKKIDSVIFELTDNLGKKEIKNALNVLRNLIYSKEPIQKILITLYNHFKKLYLLTIALKNNKDIISSINLKPNQTFLINKYKLQAKYFNEKELREIIQRLIDLDYNYKNGLIDLEIGLESILCTYCS